ncbi:MAG: hypothetical protein N2257_07960 [Thermodesulfovibrionales bacterium]|nr:hypothetical protein [Thermodesulfovibrionales bacterium]
MEKLGLITGLFNLAFILNLPSGFLRGGAKRFSPRWFIFIHLPIPFIALARIFSHIEVLYIPLFLLSSILGQIIGNKIRFEV